MLIPFFLAWGSFLNVVAYRLIHECNLATPRSFCPHCKKPLAWYDLIPVISYFLLGGRCRACKQSISWLYPFIEILTTLVMLALFTWIAPGYLPAYFVFFSALIVTIRSDLETMLISRHVTLFLIPLGWFLAAIGLLPINLWQSLLGSLMGYLILLGAARLYFWIRKTPGMGQGDLELLAFIGAFIGPFGCWITLMLASCLGTLAAALYMLLLRQKSTIAIPFGPFLATGAIIFVLFEGYFMEFFS